MQAATCNSIEKSFTPDTVGPVYGAGGLFKGGAASRSPLNTLAVSTGPLASLSSWQAFDGGLLGDSLLLRKCTQLLRF